MLERVALPRFDYYHLLLLFWARADLLLDDNFEGVVDVRSVKDHKWRPDREGAHASEGFVEQESLRGPKNYEVVLISAKIVPP